LKNWESESEILTRLRELTVEVRRLREDLKDELRPAHERLTNRVESHPAPRPPHAQD
jgi:uncharacterized protein involved in exopolysaccharide biosynthesis